MANGIPAGEAEQVDVFHHRRGLLWSIIGLVGALLGLLVLAMLAGAGPDATDYLLGAGFAAFLLALIAAAGWVLWRRPAALRIGPEGIEIPFAFTGPLAWRDIHRIRRESGVGGAAGKRDWLVVEPSPGVLAPLRFRTRRRLDLWFQRKTGVRIPLHGLEGDPERVVASIGRFREVRQDDRNPRPS